MFGYPFICKSRNLPDIFQEIAENRETAAQSVDQSELDNEVSDLNNNQETVENESSDLNQEVAEQSWLQRLRPRCRSAPVALPDELSEPPETQETARVKWQTLRHNGPLFAPRYQRLPNDVKFYYDNKAIDLTEQAEEVATFYAMLLDTNCAIIKQFNINFFSIFRCCLSEEQRLHIVDFELCDFGYIHEHLQLMGDIGASASLKARKREEKEHYGYCFVDGEQRRAESFRLRPPGLYYPLSDLSNCIQMGRVRPRLLPEDITINCDEFAEPPAPPPGHRWKQVVHDRRVIWLCSWVDVGSGRLCYMRPRKQSGYLTPYREQLETARRLQQHLERIRDEYRRWWNAYDFQRRKRSVALYCIDHLAMSTAGVGHAVELLALRVKQLVLNVAHGMNRERKIKLKFGNRKERIYTVDPEIHYNLTIFVAGRQVDELIFDELSAQQLEEHLEQLMDGLTAEIFRICNASRKLQDSLDLISPRGSICTQLQSYNRALKKILNWCNPSGCTFQRSARLFKQFSPKELRLQQVTDQTHQLVQATFPYLDPRITIAWCLRGRIPFQTVCGSTRLCKELQWALECTTKDFRF